MAKPQPAKLFTIGFTQSTAEHFFDRLRNAGVRGAVDMRLNGGSQLARKTGQPTASRGLMSQRRVSRRFKAADFADTCLLCAEAKPHTCHRRIVAELLTAGSRPPMAAVHL
jgi:uncharacterized protein (DUF488 family)